MSSVACLWTFSQNHISFSNSFLLLPSSTSKDPLIPLDLPRKSRTFFLSEHCCYCSIAQLGPTLCDPMDCSTPGFSVLHHLPDFAHIHIHWVSDAIQPSHPLSSPSSTLNLSQHQGLYQWVAIHIRWPKFWSFSFSFSPSNEYSGLISFRIDWFDLLTVQGMLKILKISNVNSTCNLNSLPGNVAYSQILGTRTWTSLGETPSCLSKWVFYICNIYVIYVY